MIKPLKNIAIILSLVLFGCAEGQKSIKVSNEVQNSVQPISIMGLSLDQSRAQMKSIAEETVGCRFEGNDVDSNKHNYCCINPIIRDDGSRYCDLFSSEVFVGGHSTIQLSCKAYSGCQYSAAEVMEILSEKYGLNFGSGKVSKNGGQACAISKLGERLCVIHDHHMSWNGGLGPQITLKKYKFKRKIGL